jgi:hypothetical protein
VRTPWALLLLLLPACGSSKDSLQHLATEGADCTTAEDCCVVMDDCLHAAYVVGADDYATALQLADSAAEEAGTCERTCEIPPVDVQCVEGKCAGLRVGDGALPERIDHCGSDLGTTGASRDSVVIACVPITDEHRP